MVQDTNDVSEAPEVGHSTSSATCLPTARDTSHTPRVSAPISTRSHSPPRLFSSNVCFQGNPANFLSLQTPSAMINPTVWHGDARSKYLPYLRGRPRVATAVCRSAPGAHKLSAGLRFGLQGVRRFRGIPMSQAVGARGPRPPPILSSTFLIW